MARRHLHHRRVILLGLVGLGLFAAGVWAARRGWGSVLRARMEDAGARGEWAEAFMNCRGSLMLDPRNSTLRQACRQLAGRVAEDLPRVGRPEVEVALLRWLAAEGEAQTLAEALDQSSVVIPEGEFWMGSDNGRTDERPGHLVWLSSYRISRYEVTNVQYRRFLVATRRPAPRYWSGLDYPTGQPDVPVVGVSWESSEAYCRWVGGRLPTEAEWEKACRGEAGGIYPWGEAWEPSLGNVGLAREATWGAYLDATWGLLQRIPGSALDLGLRPAGTYLGGASDYGVFDLVGNASEWVADWYDPLAYSSLPMENPLAVGPQWAHVVRGSAWFNRAEDAEGRVDASRCSARNASHSYDDPRVGFRCVWSAP